MTTRDYNLSSDAKWWEKQWVKFNIGTLIASALSFLLYIILDTRYYPVWRDELGTIFAYIFAVILLITIAGVLNFVFAIYILIESFLKSVDLSNYRPYIFRALLATALVLPFALPGLKAYGRIYHPFWDPSEQSLASRYLSTPIGENSRVVEWIDHDYIIGGEWTTWAVFQLTRQEQENFISRIQRRKGWHPLPLPDGILHNAQCGIVGEDGETTNVGLSQAEKGYYYYEVYEPPYPGYKANEGHTNDGSFVAAALDTDKMTLTIFSMGVH